MKFVKIFDNFVEINRDDYNSNNIKLYLEKKLIQMNIHII